MCVILFSEVVDPLFFSLDQRIRIVCIQCRIWWRWSEILGVDKMYFDHVIGIRFSFEVRIFTIYCYVTVRNVERDIYALFYVAIPHKHSEIKLFQDKS